MPRHPGRPHGRAPASARVEDPLIVGSLRPIIPLIDGSLRPIIVGWRRSKPPEDASHEARALCGEHKLDGPRRIYTTATSRLAPDHVRSRLARGARRRARALLRLAQLGQRERGEVRIARAPPHEARACRELKLDGRRLLRARPRRDALPDPPIFHVVVPLRQGLAHLCPPRRSRSCPWTSGARSCPGPRRARGGGGTWRRRASRDRRPRSPARSATWAPWPGRGPRPGPGPRPG
mmetsp:Transcript_3928/g.10140  ORF Transcript_3928/g.10140 Transcript_3928/m.10140 type:complete len:235 (+) Transcript_3928:205-909(+)